MENVETICPRAFSLPSPAKINRFLHIIGQREDGYHLLQTLFQYLDVGDTLYFSQRDDGELVLTQENLADLAPKDNLVFRAGDALKRATGCTQGANIHLKKRLPIGGGVGGGSSNAATTLLGLNWLWELNLSLDSLIELGTSLGADIPFFLFGHTAFGEGIGEKLTPVTLKEDWVFVVTPPCQVNTPSMYGAQDLTRNTPAFKIGALEMDDIDGFIHQQKNDFEQVARKRYNEVDDAFLWLSNYAKATLSGSGASVFACFSSREQAENVAQCLPQRFNGLIAKGTNFSPVKIAAEKLGFTLNNWGVAKR